MDKSYNFIDVEKGILEFWQKNNYFNVFDDSRPTYSIPIPPINRSGRVHVGHALNNTLQDILVRTKRPTHNINWIPGTDHAGISCQTVVTKKLLKEGKNVRQMTKQELFNEIVHWSNEYGNVIIDQLKLLGLSCNWDKIRYTMDDNYVKLVHEVFVKLYERNLIYRGMYITNWCAKCSTVLSNEEVITKTTEKGGKLYHLKYKIVDSDEYLIVATTRPETIFGDTAVAFNPNDERYKNLKGKYCIVPLINRVIPIVSDIAVEKEFATGLMKITPAHDKVDYGIYKRNPTIEVINICDKNNVLLPEYSISKNNKLGSHELVNDIINKLTELNLIEKMEQHSLTIKSCYRCEGRIENNLSDQWYVDMKPLADKVMKEKDNFNFFPSFQKNIFENWLKNIEPWCISRQQIWGPSIPVWYCNDCNHINVSEDVPTQCEKCNSNNIRQDEDVLDTWFSSWLWSFGTQDNPDKPIVHDIIITGGDILFFWVTRMMMASIEITNTLPFKDIYLHGLIRDKDGVKMSKSLGNVIDPLDVISKYGTDALRFSLLCNSSTDQDVKLDPKHFQTGKSLTIKMWNAARWILMKRDSINDMEQYITQHEEVTMLKSLDESVVLIKKFIETYEFNQYARTIYTIFWNDFCSTYLEKTKSDKSYESFKNLCKIFIRLLKLLHPIMPFITEKLYMMLSKELDKFNDIYTFRESIMIDPIN
ncbi:MAG: valine--tRNA ligase [Terrestrivirus sp.]|uniref:valine--tRNA ligase n=1 Tax=Terrestrivirus sp. TaxID=2487775 RepID=A0A3G4ZL63_9VIRU|nr:MAG: valine--tRNA ligase [Terrestrivirus sp.]